MKSCDNCYFQDGCGGQWCVDLGKHQYNCEMCGSDVAFYDFKGKKYCLNCLLQELGVESYTITHYVLDDAYIASEEEIDEAILDVNDDIKIIEG